MSKIFLVNVGANLKDQSLARSPIFNDDRFIFVSFPDPDTKYRKPYPPKARPFTRNVGIYNTHADPDWDNLTYGDCPANGRAAALKQAKLRDILLFWALLWRNVGTSWKDFRKEKGWYLIGALRIAEILSEGQRAKDAKSFNVKRAAKKGRRQGSCLVFAI